MTENRFTLVTGGSAGIGLALARECARRGRNVLLAALPGPELEAAERGIRAAFGVETGTLAVDLAERDGPRRVYDWCREIGAEVDFLVNNAGVGGTSRFAAMAPGDCDLRIQLNIRATVLLTRLFLPELGRHPRAWILNVASFSAFFPIPYKSVFAASKAFVLSFSLAVREELRGTPVSLTVLCPNGVATNAGTTSRIAAHGRWGRWTEIAAADLARVAVARTLRGDGIVVPKRINRLLRAAGAILPLTARARLLEREFRREFAPFAAGPEPRPAGEAPAARRRPTRLSA